MHDCSGTICVKVDRNDTGYKQPYARIGDKFCNTPATFDDYFYYYDDYYNRYWAAFDLNCSKFDFDGGDCL